MFGSRFKVLCLVSFESGRGSIPCALPSQLWGRNLGIRSETLIAQYHWLKTAFYCKPVNVQEMASESSVDDENDSASSDSTVEGPASISQERIPPLLLSQMLLGKDYAYHLGCNCKVV